MIAMIIQINSTALFCDPMMMVLVMLHHQSILYLMNMSVIMISTAMILQIQ